MAKITKRTVDAAQPGTARRYLWDSALPGFGLVVQMSGVKSYVYQYRSPEGQSRRIALGRHGELTPEQAREIAEKHATKVKAGGDPLEEKRGRRGALMVSDMFDLYLKSEDFARFWARRLPTSSRLMRSGKPRRISQTARPPR